MVISDHKTQKIKKEDNFDINRKIGLWDKNHDEPQPKILLDHKTMKLNILIWPKNTPHCNNSRQVFLCQLIWFYTQMQMSNWQILIIIVMLFSYTYYKSNQIRLLIKNYFIQQDSAE